MALTFFQDALNKVQQHWSRYSFWPDYQRAYAQGQDALKAFGEQAASRYPDWVSAGGPDLVGADIANMQAEQARQNSTWRKAGQLGAVAGAGLMAVGAGAGIGTALSGAEAGAAGAGAAGTGEAVSGTYGAEAGTGAAGAAATTGLEGIPNIPTGLQEITQTIPDISAADQAAISSAAMGGAAAGAAGSAVSRILQGNGTADDYLKVLGSAAPALLGAYASNQQTGALKDLAGQYLEYGAPSRARYESSYAPGFTMANDPGYTDALNAASKATLHGLSTQGNPAGSPNAWAQSLQDLYSKTAYPALQTFRNQNANTGGIGTLTAAAPGAATGAIASQGNVYNAIGAGINDVFNPRSSLTDLLRALPRYA